MSQLEQLIYLRERLFCRPDDNGEDAFPAFARTSYGIGPSYLPSLAHKSTGLFALQFREKTLHVQNMLHLSLSKGGENGQGVLHVTTVKVQLCYRRFLRGLRRTGVACGSSARLLGPWRSCTDALIFLRPRPPSIQLTPQFRIAVFRKSCPHAESDRISPQPATFAAGRRLAFRSCAGDHVRSPTRAVYRRLRCVAARGSDGRRSESSLHRVPLFKQTYIRSEANIRSISPRS